MKNGNTIKTIISILFLMAMVLFFGQTGLFGQADEGSIGVGIDERLGNIVPLDVVFKDENGNAVS